MTAAEFATVGIIEPDWVSDNVQPIYIDSELGPSAGYEAYLRAIDENPELMGEKIRDAIEGLQGTHSEPRDWESYRDAVNAYYTNIIDVVGTDNAMGKTASFEQEQINAVIDDILGIERNQPAPDPVVTGPLAS